MDHYSIFLQYDTTDRIYVASIPELPGCMAHGDTREQALREISIASRLWVETARDLGKSIPQPNII